jgi:hypothetical protein
MHRDQGRACALLCTQEKDAPSSQMCTPAARNPAFSATHFL